MSIRRLILCLLGAYLTSSAAEPTTVLLDIHTADAPDRSSAFARTLLRELENITTLRVLDPLELNSFLEKERLQPQARHIQNLDLLLTQFSPGLILSVRLGSANTRSQRKQWVPVLGERIWSLSASVRLYAPNPRHNIADSAATATASLDSAAIAQAPLKGTLFTGEMRADTSASTGWCGVLRCIVPPASAGENLAMQEALGQKIALEIQQRLRELLVIPATQ